MGRLADRANSTESATVQSGYQAWIKDLVQTYGIDGLRIDAAKHVQASFWQPFCVAAGVFCMGEVFGDDVGLAAQYASPAALDSILNYPLYDALVAAFAIPGPANVSALQAVLAATQAQIADPTVLGNFLENQDNPRWANMSVDVQSMYNAMTYTFMSDG
jgi:alpha-amylase